MAPRRIYNLEFTQLTVLIGLTPSYVIRQKLASDLQKRRTLTHLLSLELRRRYSIGGIEREKLGQDEKIYETNVA